MINTHLRLWNLDPPASAPARPRTRGTPPIASRGSLAARALDSRSLGLPRPASNKKIPPRPASNKKKPPPQNFLFESQETKAVRAACAIACPFSQRSINAPSAFSCETHPKPTRSASRACVPINAVGLCDRHDGAVRAHHENPRARARSSSGGAARGQPRAVVRVVARRPHACLDACFAEHPPTSRTFPLAHVPGPWAEPPMVLTSVVWCATQMPGTDRRVLDGEQGEQPRAPCCTPRRATCCGSSLGRVGALPRP